MNDAAIVADDTLEETADIENIEGEVVEGEEETPNLTLEQKEEKITFDVHQQAKVDKLLGAKTHAQREAERERDELRQQLDQTLATIPKPQRPEVPPAPDQYADDYDARVAARDAALMDVARFDVGENIRAEQQAQEKQRVIDKQDSDFNDAKTAYATRTQKLGVDPAKMQAASMTVAQALRDPELLLDILNDEQGPLITLHLGQNPHEADALARMNPRRQAVYLENVIKPKAVLLKPSINRVPAPTDPLGGGGISQRSGGPKGATYS